MIFGAKTPTPKQTPSSPKADCKQFNTVRDPYRSREDAFERPLREAAERAAANERSWCEAVPIEVEELLRTRSTFLSPELQKNHWEAREIRLAKTKAGRKRLAKEAWAVRALDKIVEQLQDRVIENKRIDGEREARRELEAKLEPLKLEEGQEIFGLSLDATDAEICERAKGLAEGTRDMLMPRDGGNPLKLGFVLSFLGQREPAVPKFRAGDSDETIIKILIDEHAWRRVIRNTLRPARAEYDRRMGLMNGRKYASDISLRERRQQKRRNEKFFAEHELVDCKSGERVKLEAVVRRADKARAAELKRISAQMSEVAKKTGKVGIFLTFTLPSRFHARTASGRENEKLDPHETIASGIRWLEVRRRRFQNHLRARMRDAKDPRLKRISPIFGTEGVEAHTDGTAHLHDIIFCSPEDTDEIIQLARLHFVLDDSIEADDARQDHGVDAQLARSVEGAGDYILKYVLKSAGKAVPEAEELPDDNVNENPTDRERLDAWRAANRVRSFHNFWIGYRRPKVTHWRELRRLPQMDPHCSLFRLYTFARAGMFAAYVKECQRAEVATMWKEYTDRYGRGAKKIEGVVDAESGEGVETRSTKWEIQPLASSLRSDALAGLFRQLSNKSEGEVCCNYRKDAKICWPNSGFSASTGPFAAHAPPPWAVSPQE